MMSGVVDATSAEIGLEALHETRRTRAWVARHCTGKVQPALEQRLLSIERNLLAAVAADSGRALHYDSLHDGRWGRALPQRSSSTTGNSEIFTAEPLHRSSLPKLQPELQPEPESEPEPEPEPNARSDLERHVDTIVLGAAAEAWATKVGPMMHAASVSSSGVGAAKSRQQLKWHVRELESQLAALRQDIDAKEVAWDNERSQGVALIQQLKAELARASDDRAALAVAEVRVEEAEAAASAQAKVSANLRATIRKGKLRLASTEARALQYGAEVGQLKARLNLLSKELKVRDEMLAIYEQQLRQRGDHMVALSVGQSAAGCASNRPRSPPGPAFARWPSGRPPSPARQEVHRSPPQQHRQHRPLEQNCSHRKSAEEQQQQQQRSVEDSLVQQWEADTDATFLPESTASPSRPIFSSHTSSGLDVDSAFAQYERRASVLQEEVNRLRRNQQVRSKSQSGRR